MNQITSTELRLSELTLEERLKSQIRMEGPMPVAVYMQLALHDRVQGYYSTRPGLMRDFATAPEISQVFGELIGAWLVHEWTVIGEPDSFDLIEVGPGRGVLMADALRVASAHSPDFLNAMTLRLVEPSEALRREQRERLSSFEPHFYRSLEDVEHTTSLIVANEWLDCLPIRQFVKCSEGWRERVVGLSEEADALTFGLSPVLEQLPATPPEGAWEWEYSPALEAAIGEISERFKGHPGRALLFDYGPEKRTPADTLRGYSNGQQISPLVTPGEADITADVDFSAVKRHATKYGICVHGPTPQGLYLKKMGVEARVSSLMSRNWKQSDDIAAAAHKIASPGEMGSRFKAICLSSPQLPKPYAL